MTGHKINPIKGFIGGSASSLSDPEYTPLCFAFGMAVKEYTEKIGITRVQLAARARVSADALNCYDAGARAPTLPTIVAVATGLGIGADELVARTMAIRRSTLR